MAQGLAHRHQRRQPNTDREFRAAFRSGLLAAIDGLRGGMTVAELQAWYERMCGFRHGKPQPPRPRQAVQS